MKRILTLLCAVLLCCLCVACGDTPADPAQNPTATANTTSKPEKSSALLTLYADKQPFRVVTREEGVAVTLQKLEHEPSIGFFRPIADEWEETLKPGKECEIPKVSIAEMPEYRLLVRQGENIAIHYLTSGDSEIIEIDVQPWVPAPVDGNSPMANLCRAAVVAKSDEANYSYWYAIACSISTQRGVYNEFPPDEDDGYRVYEWLLEAYAAALFPDTALPLPGENDRVRYRPDTAERYWVGLAWSTWISADYKSAKRNGDGTWDVTVTLKAEDGITADEVIKLAPNKSYNPDSPFEYHIVGLPVKFDESGDDAPNPNPPPPDIVVGTWRAELKDGQAAWLEIFEDGMAGLYLSGGKNDKLYEIYRGTVYPTDDTDTQGSGVDYIVKMDFSLNWSGEGYGKKTGYGGIYTLRQEWEGYQQVLHVSLNEGDKMFGKKSLKMLLSPKTLEGKSMVKLEPVG